MVSVQSLRNFHKAKKKKKKKKNSGKESAWNAGDVDMWVGSLGQEDPMEEEMATHCSNLAQKIHGQRSLAGYS